MIKSTQTSLIHFCIIMLLGITVSCSSDNNNLEVPDNYLNIPDENFEAILIEKGIDSDGIINQQMLKSDAEKVTKLSLYGANINTLNGIEAFVNLKRLEADANHLTTLDLSNNILLDTISLTSNRLTEVEGLEKAKNLTWLSLSWNYFTEFTLDNDNVKNFLIDHNDLTSLEIANAPKLESAVLNLNQITDLDFSNSPLLEVLVFSANKLQTINLDNNVNLEYIYGSSNLLTQFDISNLPNLIDVRVDRNPTLTCIKIANGQEIPNLKLSTYQTANVDCN
jgi:protein phosphatase 1 regulatory subunit 7